jgi:hypothetical protein
MKDINDTVMKKVNINRCLSLRGENFSDNDCNIDYLAQQLHSDIAIEEKLSIATRCVNLCEKFHSYFHFEESFFHLLLAHNVDNQELYIKELEAAVFQDPLNYEAKNLLLNILPIGDDKLHDHRYIGGIKNEKYVRDIEDYSQFLLFAIGDRAIISQPPVGSYWDYFELYKTDYQIEALQSTVDTISIAHKLYHSEAAKVYYNRHTILQQIGSDILAKNDLIKSKNLDSNIAAVQK